MGHEAEEIVSKFYNEKGWNVDRGVTEDAKRWEDLREKGQARITFLDDLSCEVLVVKSESLKARVAAELCMAC